VPLLERERVVVIAGLLEQKTERMQLQYSMAEREEMREAVGKVI